MNFLEEVAREWLVPAVAFGVVVLGVLALALAWEAFSAWRRKRAATRELEKLREERPRESGDPLLRSRSQDAFPILTAVLGRLGRLKDLHLLLEQARSPMSVGSFLLLSAGFGFGSAVVVSLMGYGPLIAFPATGLGASLPYLHLRRRRARRLRAFEDAFPEAIDLLTRSVRAGHAFPSGIRVVAEECPDPVAEEFRQVFEEQKFGLPLRDSLLGLLDRVGIPDVRMFVTSVLIQRETGGNLAENMENLSRLIRERFKFRRHVKTQTAHGRMTGMVLALTPVVIAGLLFLVNREYIEILFTEPLGRAMVGIAAALQVFGFLVIRRMTALEV